MGGREERIGHLSSLKKALLALEKMRGELDAVEHTRTEPIAIVGIGCRFPGGVIDPDSFWDLLRDGVDAVTDIPASRWDVNQFYSPDPHAPGKMYTHCGGFLHDIEKFDADFFGISPREALSMDPQQRLLLEVSWETLENACWTSQQLAGTRTGVFLGISDHEYGEANGRAIDPERIDAYSGTGNMLSVAAGRIAHSLGLHGPALAIDTACSSSLVAVHLACHSLRQGECDLALAGGVNLILSPLGHVYLSRAQALSADGRCRAFDARASGYGRGEGCGIVALRRLSDAEHNSDRVLATIRGSAVNHDGKSSGLTTPNGSAQEALIRQALADARVEAHDVGYVEAHGTGTPLGDPIEVRALARVFGNERARKRRLIVGSVKTNFGHLEAAAGVAGLIKVVLSLSHGQIPRHLHFHELNPHIAPEQLPIDIAAEACQWDSRSIPRIAGLSSFGLSGTNAHLVIGSPPDTRASRDASPDRPLHVLTLSARTRAALDALCDRWATFLHAHPGLPLADVCHSANVGRTHFPWRLAVVAQSTTEAAQQLSAWATDRQIDDVFIAHARATSATPVAFVFGGEDQHLLESGANVYDNFDHYRDVLSRCEQLLAGDNIPPDDKASVEGATERELPPSMTGVTPALVAHQIAIAELWRSWNVEPAVVIGQGIGEFAAAIEAGVLSWENALKLAAVRVRAQSGCPGDETEACVAEQDCMAASIPMLSTISAGAAADLEVSDPRYWREHPLRSEHFTDTVAALLDQGVETFLGMGLPPAAFADAAGSQRVWLPATGRPGTGWHTVAATLAQLYVRGIAIDWMSFDRPYVRHKLALPSYPFQRQRYWIADDASPAPPATDASSPFASVHDTRDPLLGCLLQSPIPQHVFEACYSLAGLPLLNDHRFHDTIIVAGATYLSMAVAGATEAFSATALNLRDVAFPQPMVLSEEGSRSVQLIFTPMESGAARFTVASADTTLDASHGKLNWEPHVEGRVETEPAAVSRGQLADRSLAQLRDQEWEELSAEERYQQGWQCGLQAGPTFRWVHRLWRGDSEALGEMVQPAVLAGKGAAHTTHPGLIDSCFQLLGACLPAALFPPPPGEIPVIAYVERFCWLGRPVPERAWAHVRLRLVGNESTTRRFTCDYRLFDTEGEVLHEVTGLQVQMVLYDDVVQRAGQQVMNWVHAIEWQPAEVPRSEVPSAPSRWLILADRQGVASELALNLRSGGGHCDLVFPGQSFQQLDRDRYVVNPARTDDFYRVLQQAAVNARPCQGVIHLWSLDLSTKLDKDALAAVQAVSLESTIHLLQALVASSSDPPRLWLVTRAAQQVGEHALALAQTPLWGLANVISLEHPELRCVCVDLDPAATSSCGPWLSRELRYGGEEDHVAFRQERHVARWVPRQPVRVSAARDATQVHTGQLELLRGDATYLITGGLGALGRLVARWMVASGARHLILLSSSRDTLPAEDAAHYQTAGAQVQVAKADVSQRQQLSQLLAGITADRPLRGVVHAAGTLSDCSLLKMDSAALSAVLLPKVHGAWNLHELTQMMDLDFFVLFSSASSVIGSPGQGNYAAANAFLDALAHHRHGQGLPAMSLNWGPWLAEGGMATQTLAQDPRRWQETGIIPLAPNQGLEILGQMLVRDMPQATVMPIEWHKFVHRFAADRPIFSQVVQSHGSATAVKAPQSQMVATLRKAEPAEQRELLVRHLQAEAAKILGLDPTKPLDPVSDLSELGLDSLMAIELRNALQETTGRSLPATLLYEHPTLESLADYLLEDLGLHTPTLT